MINWNKPLRTVLSQIPVTVAATLPDGSKVLTWETFGRVVSRHVNADGSNAADTKYPGFLGSEVGGRLEFENVPEEPKDHLLIARLRNGEWRIQYGKPVTRSAAESGKVTCSGMGEPAVIVKVPA